MGLLDFFVDTGKKDKVVGKVVAEVGKVVTSFQTPVQPVAQEDVGLYEKQLMTILQTAANKGFFDFMTTKAKMKQSGSEADAYNAIYSVLNAMQGVEKNDLVVSAQNCITMVLKEMADFEGAYKQQVVQQQSNDQAMLDEKRRKVLETEQLLNNLKNELMDIQQRSAAKLAGIGTKHDAFMTAGNNIQNQVQEEINKITKYIN